MKKLFTLIIMVGIAFTMQAQDAIVNTVPQDQNFIIKDNAGHVIFSAYYEPNDTPPRGVIELLGYASVKDTLRIESLMHNSTTPKPLYITDGGEVVTQGVSTYPVKTVSASYTITNDDYTIYQTASHNITLPDPDTIPGRVFLIKAGNISGTIDVTPQSGDKIDGATGNKTLAAWKYIKVQSLGSGGDWIIIGQN